LLLPIFSLVDPAKSVSHSNTNSSAPVSGPSKTVAAEPVHQRPSARRVVGREAYSTPSISDALKDDVKAEVIGIVSEINPEEYSKKDAQVFPFTQPELVEAWKNFVLTIESAQLKSALGAREPLLLAGWQIEFELDTELQLNRLALDLKPKLQSFLRHQFRNEAIEILFKVSTAESQPTGIPYTDAERWALLAEKYPSLATLKSKFGLDFEHF